MGCHGQSSSCLTPSMIRAGSLVFCNRYIILCITCEFLDVTGGGGNRTCLPAPIENAARSARSRTTPIWLILKIYQKGMIDAGAGIYQQVRRCASPTENSNRDFGIRHRLAAGLLRGPGRFGMPCSACQGRWLPGRWTCGPAGCRTACVTAGISGRFRHRSQELAGASQVG